jgi:superfamily II DNA or RNA helicase
MTSRPSRVPEAADLRPYQRRIFWGLRDKARDGERDLGLSAPVGSGKTTVCKALACDLLLETEHPAQFRGVIFLAPLESIVEAWQEPARIREAPFAFGDPDHPAWEFRGAGSAREWLAAPRASVADLSDPAWWQTARGLWAATRQSGGRQVVISALRESRPSLAGWLVVVDEAHGAGSETLAGELCAVVRELGGATLLVSATPWRGDGESVFGAATAVEGISSAAYSRETDERGRPYCPRQWEVRRTRVRGVIARTVADVVDDGGSADRRDEGPAKVATAYARTMVARWVADGRPKTVMNVPRVSWVRRADGRPGPLLAELLRAGVPRDRVLDLVGKLAPAAAREAAERLKSERGVRRFEDSAIDVVLSCARFDEGSDWPLCSHVYNAKIPRSSRLIIQRWGRASRPKGRIAGYPEQWRDAQVLRFFVASLPGEVADAAWAEHRDMSLMLACYLEDFAVARRFASAAAGVFRAAERRARGVGHRGRLGDRGESGAQRAAAREIEQVSGDSELERSALRREIMRATRAGARRPEDVLAHLERRLPGSTPQQRQAGLLAFAYGDQSGSRVERLQRAVDAAVRKVAEQAARAPKPQGWVKAELREVLAAVAEDFADVMISPRSDLIEQAARFTGHRAGEFAERLRGEGGYPWPETREGLIAFAQEHGRRYFEKQGTYPNAMSGEISGTTWMALDSKLRAEGLSLREIFGRRGQREQCEIARMVFEWKERNGREPSAVRHRIARPVDPEELRRGLDLQILRRSARRGSEKAREAIEVFDLGLVATPVDKDTLRRRMLIPLKQFVALGQAAVPFCHAWKTRAPQQRSSGKVGGDVGQIGWSGLQGLLQKAHKPEKSKSRSLHLCADLCQVSSLVRLGAEIAVDCWRLWLDGADKPDPRPWADILAAGDNTHVVRAERVAFLDWQRPGRDGKPARRPWPQAQWPDLRAAPGPQELREAA